MRVTTLALASLLALAPPLATADPLSIKPTGNAHGVIAVSVTGDAQGAIAVSVLGDARALEDECISTLLPHVPSCVRVVPLAAVSVAGDATADKIAISGFGHAYTYLLGVSACDDAGACGLP